MQKLVLSLTFLTSFTQASYAWEATINGPDVFGKTKVVATEGRGRTSLIIQCDSDSELYLAYIFEKKKFDDINDTPAKLYVKTSPSGPTVLDAQMRDWNDNYAGIVVTGRTKELIEVIALIGNAKAKIEVGYEVLGFQESDSFSSNRSQKTVKTVFDKCKIEKPVSTEN